MNNMTNMTNMNSYENIPVNDIIFTDMDIYKKVQNLDGSFNLFILNLKDKNYIWEKSFSLYTLPNDYHSIDCKYLSYTVDNTISNDTNHTYMTIYRVDESEKLTHTMIFNKNEELIWNDTPSILNSRLLNKFTISQSIENISMHIDLTKDNSCSDPYDIILGDNEPLEGWDLSDCDINNINFENIHNDINISDNISPMIDKTTEVYPDEILLEEKYEEYRIDPYDNEWYSEREFINYYGGTVEWDHQHPKNILLREEYYKFVNNYSHLNNKKFMFLFNKYAKTFNSRNDGR